jgi:hypothetical protein
MDFFIYTKKNDHFFMNNKSGLFYWKYKTESVQIAQPIQIDGVCKKFVCFHIKL